jgi:hypothetical protein
MAKAWQWLQAIALLVAGVAVLWWLGAYDLPLAILGRLWRAAGL